MGHGALAKEALRPRKRSIDDLIHEHERARRQIFA